MLRERKQSLYRLYSVVLAILFLASLMVRKGQDVLWINGHYSEVEDHLFALITNFGNGTIFIVILLATLFIRFQYTVITAIVWVGHGILVSIFKELLFPGLERPRKVLDTSVLHFIPGVDVHGYNTFPSGHTATAFCAALLLTLIYRNKRVGFTMLILALLVAYSRIYLLQHFLMDVAAGAIIGCFTTYVVWEMMEARQKPLWMRRKLSTKYKVRGTSIGRTS